MSYNHSKKQNNPKKPIFFICFFICMCVFLFSAYKIFSIINEYLIAEKYYSTVQEYSPFKNGEIEKKKNKQLLEIDTDSLKKINEDFIGWIYAKGTKINYPVVKGTDNSFYVTHGFDKNLLQNGSVFMDSRCDSDFKNHNTIIYGHNMKDGSMFGELDKYRNSSFYEKHKEMLYVDKTGEIKKLQIFSARIVKSTSNAYKYDFGTDDRFSKFIENTVTSSLYDTGIRPTSSDKIVTLSTCSYEYDEARLVVHAILLN